MRHRPPRWLFPAELDPGRLRQAVEYLADRAGDESATSDRPVFILSAGWRSGSTLLQRLLCSDPTILVWGEPYGDQIPIIKLAAGLTEFGRYRDPFDRLDEIDTSHLATTWIATISPSANDLRRAHRAFFLTLFAEPARERGFERWGVKWVRLSADYACYLRWLFPEARIIFLTRNPISSLRSYKWKRWFSVRPSFRVDNAVKFFAHWNQLAKSFVGAEREPNSLLIRYEDLIADPESLERLAVATGLELERAPLDLKLDFREVPRAPAPLRPWDVLAAKLICGKTCSRLGYPLDFAQRRASTERPR